MVKKVPRFAQLFDVIEYTTLLLSS